MHTFPSLDLWLVENKLWFGGFIFIIYEYAYFLMKNIGFMNYVNGYTFYAYTFTFLGL